MEIRTDQKGIQHQQEPSKQRQDFSHIKCFNSTLTERLIVKNDTVSISGSSKSTAATYGPDASFSKIEADAYEQLRNMVTGVLKEQGIDSKIAIGDTEIDISGISQAEAQELIAEDGYFGVAQTSDRIVDFAMSISGNDPTRIEAIREGIEKGFNEAMEAFGGSLPEISHETYKAVQEKLDAWVAESSQE